MLVIFTGAVLFVTGAVALLALVGSWWMLGVAFAIHVATTAVVMLTIVYVMAGPKRAIRVGDRPSPTPTPHSGDRADLVAAPGVFAPRPPADGCGPRPRRNRDKRRRRLNPRRDRRWRDIRTGFRP